MKNMLLMATLFALATHAQAGTAWPDLWRNADQRGEALLQQGKAKDAAGEFADPRRKSYAEFKAGDYASAAHGLSALDDSDAHYNRGNALAYAGDLQGALNAYDAALKRDPHNQDARHNRELVAKALKEQQQKQQKTSGKNSPQAGKQDQKQEGKQPDNQDSKDSSSADAQQQKQARQPESRDAAGQKQSGTQAQQAGNRAAGQGDSRATQQDAQKKQDNKTDDAAQAKRDADAGMKAGKQDEADGGAQRKDMQGRNAQTAPAPLTEKQISQDQWLRSIPDDPSGLLRRKFLIEHMLRQQRAQR